MPSTQITACGRFNRADQLPLNDASRVVAAPVMFLVCSEGGGSVGLDPKNPRRRTGLIRVDRWAARHI